MWGEGMGEWGDVEDVGVSGVAVWYQLAVPYNLPAPLVHLSDLEFLEAQNLPM